MNSFFYVKTRGIWLNRGNKTWYEIDGFVAREEDRSRIVKALKSKNNFNVSLNLTRRGE